MTLFIQTSEGAGKLVGDKRYLHVDALPTLAQAPEGEQLLERVGQAEVLADVRRGEQFNLVWLDLNGSAIVSVSRSTPYASAARRCTLLPLSTSKRGGDGTTATHSGAMARLGSGLGAERTDPGRVLPMPWHLREQFPSLARTPAA